MLFVQRFNVRQVAHAPRSVQTGSFQDHEIEIVTGYDAVNDRYPIHIRTHRAGGAWQRIESSGTWGADEADAFEQGWKIVARWVAAIG